MATKNKKRNEKPSNQPFAGRLLLVIGKYQEWDFPYKKCLQ